MSFHVCQTDRPDHSTMAPDKDRISWLLLICVAVTLTGSAESRQQIPKPRTCDSAETWFRHRRSFVYNYVATVIAGFSGTSSTVTGSRLSCEVTVNVPKRCEIVMQLSGCILKETGLDDKPVVSKKSKQLAKLLNRYEVYVQMDRGSVLEQRLLVDEREPVYILNIKRAIISQMQLPILPWKQYDKPLLLHDHFGTCPTEVSLEGQSKSLKTRRDISQCSLTQLFGRQLHPMSFAKQFEIHVLQRPISEVVYPFESKVECQYKIGNNRITASTCQHGQIFKPITFDGELTAATAVNVTQSLTLTSARKLSRKKAAVNRHLNGRQFVDLTMQLEVDPPQVVSSSRLLQALEDIIAASFKPSTSADENMVPEKFRSFVDLARNVKSKELGEALEAILACRETEKCGLPELSSGQMAATALQKQRELFFTDGIFTCGTEACVATYLDCVQRGDVVSSLEAEVTLLNMALFYQPAPAVLTSMLALCKSSNTSSSNCWLTLGTLTGRLAQTLGQHAPAQQQEGQAAVSRVLQGMRQMMGDICIPGALARTPRPQQPATLSHLLLALKSLANAGEVLNGSKDGEDLMIAAVLQCVNNTDLPNSVATAALNVLSKVDLKPPIHVALTTLLGDRARPVAHRTMAFDRLVRHHNVSTVHHLADVIVREKLVSLQTYMVTRVGHLLESNNPKEYSLRTVWRSVLKTKPLPVLEQLKGRGSQYAEFSRYVEHPLSKHLLGAKLGIGVVFEPSNLVPSQLRVSVSSVLFNHSVELLEVGVDMQGMENIARELLTQGLYPADGMGAGVARLVQAMLPKTGETPTLFFQDMKVMEALKKLMTRINMPSGDTVQAQFHVKVFGSEVGFVDAQDVVRIVRGQKQSMGRGRQHAGVTTWAQKLAEGLKLFVGKSSNLVEVVRMFPTVAGLPWRAQVHGTMVASASFNAGGDVAKFLTRKGPLKIAGDAAASVGVRVLCEESVAIGDLTSSGVRLNISVLVKGGAEGRMRLGPRPGSKLPQGGKVLELGLGATKEPFTFISARSDIYQMHNGEQRMITTPRTQVPMDMCVPGFVQRWSGQVLCLKGFYQHVPIKPNNPMPIVSGPVHLDVTIKRVDKSLKEYTAAFLLKQEQMKDQSSPLIDFGANFSAAGDKLKRQLEVSVKVSPESKAIQGRVRVPEFGLRYSLDLSTSLDAPGTPRLKGASGGTDVHHLLSSVLSVGPDVMHSMILEVQNKTIGVDNSFLKVMLLKANMSMPGLSLEVSANSSVAQNPGLTTSQGLYMRYYCQPHYGLLYTLHGKPKLAASNGHVSTWSITNVARIQGQFLSDTWRAADIMTILAPGHNITLTNQITANFTWASRRSKLFWTYGLGTPNVSTDLITMDAEVRNESVGRHQNLHYVMQLDHKDKYDVMVEGSLRGPVSNMAFQTDIVYTSKAIRAGRERRSLRSIANRLKRLEERAEEAVETIEEMVIRRGAELTEAFLKWMAEEPASKSQKQDGVKTTGVAEITSVATPVASGATVGQLNVGFLASIFRRRSWKMDIDANLKYKPRKELGSARPVGYDLQWDLHVHLPHLNNDLLFFNGTLNRLPRYSCGMDWRFHSDVLNFTLAYFLQQRIAYPAVYHWHHWKLVEFTKHRYDRSFSFLLDLERDDHFMYHMLLVSPRTNLTHQINYSLPNPQLHTVRAIFNLHHEDPVFDIKWREKSNLTPKGLTTDVSLNSTWLNMVLDSDVDWSTPGALMVTQRLDTLGRVSFFKGPAHLDVKVKLDPQKANRKPSMTIQHNSTAGVVRTMTGQLLSKDLVFFTFSSLQPRSKKAVTLLNWHIRLLEPTLLEHSLSWEAPMTEPLFTDLYHFYRVGAHSFLLFGETVADNVYRNVSDMILPFTNSTISQVVDRVVQGRMKKVAVAGLDPRMNVPIATKLLKGGLKLAQALQLSWQKSQIGRLAYKVGVHRAVSTAAWLSTRLHYMVVQDPPFPLKQYIKFYIMPTIRAAAASRQFNFTVPLPFVWEQYLSRPQPRLLSRQRQRRLEMNKGVLTDLPFMALLDRDHVHTFDGLHYDINVPKKTPCTYLLCTDLGVKNQSLLLNQGSATMVLRQSSVSLAWKGTVLINDSTVPQAVSKLPANLTHDQAKVSLSNGQLTVSVEGQMRMTYDQESQIYVIEMAGHLHNQSVGLLGTTTRDSGDDLRLPSGHIMANTSGFQQEYELSGQAVCKKESGQRVSSSSSDSSCEDLNAQVCRDLFTKGVSSPLESCFSVVDPQHFLDLCVRRTCQKLTHDPTKACPVVSTYVRLCANKGRQVKADTQTYRNACDSCSTGRQSRGSRHTVDLVMCPAMSSSDRSPEEMVNVIGNLAGHLNKGSRFGLVHGYKNHVHAHLFDGELFVTSKKLHKKLDASKLKAKENERGDNNHPPRVSDILEIAANYPFRASARRFVVLFTGPSTPRAQNVTQLQNQLSGQAISLIHVSTDLDFARVLSASWDGQVICRGCNRNEISIATTDMGKLAAETQGMYMSFDALKKGRSTRMRKLMRPFENIVSQPSPQCVGVTRGA